MMVFAQKFVDVVGTIYHSVKVDGVVILVGGGGDT